jgi:hypothetical protein
MKAAMSVPFFFGYGSLVNRATHDYPHATSAVLSGWRRAWVHTSRRPYAYLSATPAEGAEISGLIAAVPDADWTALDLREIAYERLPLKDGLRHDHPAARDVAIYSVPHEARRQVTETHPILLSYLDVVLQGYLREFGEDGAERFIDTTDGWDAPVLDDREAPIYPRHQPLTPAERGFIDAALSAAGSRRIHP